MFASMKIFDYVVLLVLLLAMPQLHAQELTGPLRFGSPLGIDLSVTGSFGEIRPNHFHSGVDFQVQQKEGLPVYSIADGWVSRVKVSPVGFGKAIYIDHPGGYTSVYAHLYNYNDSVREYVRQKQYQLKSFDVDLFPANEHDSIFVKQGDLIGYAGNSGSSFGPHLHFEIRTTQTERILNPLSFGFNYTDRLFPDIELAMLYPADQTSIIEGENREKKWKTRKISPGEYRLANGDTVQAWGRLFFGVQANDYFSSRTDRNGWYSVQFTVDKVPVFSMQMDSFAFAESRFVNSCIDYRNNYRSGQRIIRSARSGNNKFSLVRTGQGDGTVSLRQPGISEVSIDVGDYAGNHAVLRFWIRSDQPSRVISVGEEINCDTAVHFSAGKENAFEAPGIQVTLPSGSLYEDFWFTYSRLPARKGIYSAMHKLGSPEIPLHRKMKVAVKATTLPQRLRPKAMLARKDEDGRQYPAGGRYSNGFVEADTYLFDTYYIVVDTIPPRIQAMRSHQKNKQSLKLRVTDNFSGIGSYQATINGSWALVEWDPKNDLMEYKYDELLVKGKNRFRIDVTDEKGNKAHYSTTITKH